ncbi:medium chain dehydrogenase/reductase family protein [Conexibacter sp. JD483]|uniref:medium chain dehydrogenase/reductase family protein n=1 Tax=unclassified Conexibacter TaxID=2627773 RepID=UPI00271C0195|nr:MULTISPECIES: medium chain dehydrogenase/reductase family protein [unclassified Conexibacter]MDO8189026.1 medium chain dehydrogenase/reductase family protein [Conexibacter sp. CPCC 205706]MDO8201426.1 medium chain dehydrogenase/reductase family protein [Conexibacter sp. CPCC 205762]MDR9373150.1 medium chain dehydrogenase/reductase family protein [Conexibacter sp. JD483]
MRTLQIELPAIGAPETLRAVRRELPEPGAGEALVRVEATGVSFAEQQMRRGKYYDQPAFPFVPGYDLVGVIERLGGGSEAAGAGSGAAGAGSGAAGADGGAAGAGDGLRPGMRVAALTRTGAWAERVVLDRADLVPLPDGLDAVAAETAIVNGVTAQRMLHRSAKVSAGETIVVLGAAGGVGSLLVQLARAAGVRVIGVAGGRQQQGVAALGAIAVDYRAEDVPARVRELAPDGVAAVFDHVGGAGIEASWRMLARGGTLVSYGTAATKDEPGNPRLPVLKLLGRLTLWNLLPNGRRALFFNLWAGRRLRPARYRAELREDLTRLFALLADGELRAQVAGRFPLADAAAALRFAEQGGNTGKVVLLAGA